MNLDFLIQSMRNQMGKPINVHGQWMVLMQFTARIDNGQLNPSASISCEFRVFERTLIIKPELGVMPTTLPIPTQHDYEQHLLEEGK